MKNELKLYGEIFPDTENSAKRFIERLNEACEGSNDVINLHIHCYGGSVIEGNLIYNAIAQCKKPVDVYVDGLAASMGSVIIMAARKIYMAKNAFLMVHAPSACVVGTAEEMEKEALLLRKMENVLIAAYAKRTGNKEDDIKEWMKGDNWFSAEDALLENLCDGVVDVFDADILPKDVEITKLSASALMRHAALFNNLNKHQEMDKKSLIEKFGLTGVTPDSSDAEIMAALEAKFNEGTNGKKAAEEELANMKKKQITDAVSEAIKANKIPESQRANYVAIGEKNGIETLTSILGEIKVAQPSIIGALGKQGGSPSNERDSWDWEKWQANDPRGLEKMKVEDPDKFKALYDAKYSK